MRIFDDAAAMGAELPGGWLSIGNFDGMHAGHRHVLGLLVATARAAGAPALAMTFTPHPAALLSPRGAPARLASASQQAELFAAMGLDGVLCQRFDSAFAEVSADAFCEDWLLARLKVRGLLVGENFRFGKDRAGDVASLRRLAGDRLEVRAAAPFVIDGELASSTRVRRLLAEGRVGESARLLGRPHAIEGRVMAGDGRGRTLGFPTANVDSGPQALPLQGVYASVLRIGDRRLRAVSNIGTRPTFDGRGLVHEVHALEDPGALEGRLVRVAFLERLRDERRFDGVEALRAQIRADVLACAPIHAASPPASLASPAF